MGGKEEGEGWEGLKKHVEEVAGVGIRGMVANGKIDEGDNTGSRGWDRGW